MVNEPAIFEEAKAKGSSFYGQLVEHAANELVPKLFVFGNAPTSIFKVLDMVEERNTSS